MEQKQSSDNIQFLSILGFVILSVLVHYLPNVDLSISSIRDGIFSEANFNNVDIKSRKNLIWKFLFFSSIFTFAFHLIWSKIKANSHFDFFREGLAFLSFIGICIYWMQVMGISVDYVENLLYASFIVLPFYAFLKYKNPKSRNFITESFGAFLLANIALSFLFILILPKGDYLTDNFLFATILLSLIIFFLPKLPTKPSQLISKLSVLVYTIPLWYFIALELLVVKQIGGSGRATFLLVMTGIPVSALLLFFAWKENLRGLKVVVGALMVIALATLSYYEFAITIPTDQFEIANRANAMMRFFHFGELPFIDYLSSHNLFDHLWPFLYTFVNGYSDNVSFLSYSFARHTITALGGFVLMYYLFRNWAWAALFLIIFPFNRALFPMAMALFMPIILSKSYDGFSGKYLKWIPIYTIFLIMWKMDVGFGNLVAVLVSLAVYFYHFGDSDKFKKLIKTVIIPASVLLVLFVVFGIFKGFPYLFKNISQALGYFSADQAHGLSALTIKPKDKIFIMHYFVFPTVVFLIATYLILNFKKIFAERQRLLIALIYLSIFYFANFQRGLVRHSFLSGSDAFLSSYVFLIFGLFTSLFVNRKYQWLVFVIVPMFMIHNFRFAEAKGLHSNYNQTADFVKSLPAYQIKNTRYVEDRMLTATKPYSNLKKFFDAELSENQTFIDFTNAPMTYFYTQRKVPSYFNQYLQNTVTRKLQRQNIASLDLENIPFVLFQNEIPKWGDMTDGVSNKLRYIELTELIYENYHPYDTIDDKEVWVHNDYQIQFPDIGGVGNWGTFIKSEKNIYLGSLPNFFDEDILIKNTIALREEDGAYYPTSNPSSWKKNYLHIELKESVKDLALTLKITYPYEWGKEVHDVEMVFVNVEGSKKFEIPLSWLEGYYKNRDELIGVKFKLSPNRSIEKMSIIEAKFDE